MTYREQRLVKLLTGVLGVLVINFFFQFRAALTNIDQH